MFEHEPLSLIRLRSALVDAQGRLEQFYLDLKENPGEQAQRYVYAEIARARQQIYDLKLEIRRFWE